MEINCSYYLTLLNSSRMADMVNESRQITTLTLVHHYAYGVIIPLVCAFGFVGNILNIVIFTRKKNNKVLDEVEHCTTICLVALAVSDMMFCLCTFPNAFVPEKMGYSPSSFSLHYRTYYVFLINIFILTSTMLTVLTAVMRYLAICHPFRSRQFITVRVTALAICGVGVFSVAFNIPSAWQYKVGPLPCDQEGLLSIQESNLYKNVNFEYANKLMWAVLGNFIPLAVLLYCNVRLIQALHQSKQLRLLHSRDDTSCLSAHRRINITLITIIIIFFILVAPSDITKFCFYIINKHRKRNYTYKMVAVITNTLQTINFSINFILYYVIIAPFRKTIHEFVCVFSHPKRAAETRNIPSTNSGKHTITLLSIKEQQQNCV